MAIGNSCPGKPGPHESAALVSADFLNVQVKNTNWLGGQKSLAGNICVCLHCGGLFWLKAAHEKDPRA